jgi:hypothetical protein
MRLALDFDATYTVDPELWEAFVKLAKERGHEVTIVTARCENGSFAYPDLDNDDVIAAAGRMGIDVVYCCGNQKQDIYGADVWIDDSPHAIVGREQLEHLKAVSKMNDYHW